MAFKNNLFSPLIDKSSAQSTDQSSKQGKLIMGTTTYICKSPNDLNYIYKGKIDNTLLTANKDDSHFFTVKPGFKTLSLPKKLRQGIQPQSNLSSNKIENVGGKGN